MVEARGGGIADDKGKSLNTYLQKFTQLQSFLKNTISEKSILFMTHLATLDNSAVFWYNLVFGIPKPPLFHLFWAMD